MGSDELVERYEISAIYGERWPHPEGEWVQYSDHAKAIEALTAQLAEARESERAAVVAWLRNRDEPGAEYLATWIEAGDHRT